MHFRAEPSDADPDPRIIARMQRGVVMNRSSSDTAGWRMSGGRVVAYHSEGGSVVLPRPQRDIHRAGPDQAAELAGGTHTQLDLQTLRPRREPVDEAGRGMFGEHARGRDAEQPSAVRWVHGEAGKDTSRYTSVPPRRTYDSHGIVLGRCPLHWACDAAQGG